MDAILGFPLLSAGADVVLTTVNRQLAKTGLTITYSEALMLAERRAESLSRAELVEFGTPALAVIAEAVATSPNLSQSDIAGALAGLQETFYTLRAELPVDVPDDEIAEALRGCLDAWGDAALLASMPIEDVMAFSDEYVRNRELPDAEYRIADDEGHTYTYNPIEWDYDELADGWDGEAWADDWDD